MTALSADVLQDIMISSFRHEGEVYARSLSEFDKDDSFSKMDDNLYYHSDDDVYVLIHSFHQIDEIAYNDEATDEDKDAELEGTCDWIRDDAGIPSDYSKFSLERRCIKFDGPNAIAGDYYRAYGIGVIRFSR